MPSELRLSEILLERLSEINAFSTHVFCRRIPETFTPREGEGSVIVARSDNIVTFCEKGIWYIPNRLPFTNVLRWRFISKENLIAVEHLRFGAERPIFLFHLMGIDPFNYKSVMPHECGEDYYSGALQIHEWGMQLSWRIKGPEKKQEIITLYSMKKS